MAEDEVTVHKILPSTLVKGGYLMIKKNACWVTEITAKVCFNGRVCEVWNCVVLTQSVCSTGQRYRADCQR